MFDLVDALWTKEAIHGINEQVGALAAALCRPGDHELLRDRGLDVGPLGTSPQHCMNHRLLSCERDKVAGRHVVGIRDIIDCRCRVLRR
jgi:hypothetical protein